MDGPQFDDLLRRLARSRRSAIATLLVAAGGLSAELAGDAKRKKKKNKKKHGGGKNGGGATQPPTNNFPAGAIPCTKHSDCATGLRCHPAGFCECTPPNCTGCCIDETHCLMLGQMTDDACGYDGLYCNACPNLTRCTNTDKECRCDAESNPEGCCSEHGVYGFPGNTNELCGKNGDVCVPCGPGEGCIDQECKPLDCTGPCADYDHCSPRVCSGGLVCCPADVEDTCNVPPMVCNCIIEGGYCTRI